MQENQGLCHWENPVYLEDGKYIAKGKQHNVYGENHYKNVHGETKKKD